MICDEFFGSSTGMFFDSGSWSNSHFFLKFIKKLNNDTWEKPSKGEGKIIKFSLEEMVYILRLLNREELNWNTYHTFQEKKTQISFGWDKENKEVLHITGGDYYKKLNYAEVVVLKALLEHVFDEKIAHSTVNSKNGSFKKSGVDDNTIKPELTVSEEIISNSERKKRNTTQVSSPQVEKVYVDDSDYIKIEGVCKGETEKALLIKFEGKREIWIPKSTIHSDFEAKSDATQLFTIDSWIIEKNNIITKPQK